MKSKTVASFVVDFFNQPGCSEGSTADIMSYYNKRCTMEGISLSDNARHAIYLKAHRMVKNGELRVTSRSGNVATFAKSDGNPQAPLTEALQSTTKQKDSRLVDKKALLERISELEYELELSISEAEGYQDMKSLLPNDHDLLESQRLASKKHAIQLNGRLTSTKKILQIIAS